MTTQQVHGHTQWVPYMTVAEAAKELHLSRQRVTRLIEVGDLPAVNVALPGSPRKTWRIDKDELRRWMTSRSNTPPEE